MYIHGSQVEQYCTDVTTVFKYTQAVKKNYSNKKNIVY